MLKKVNRVAKEHQNTQKKHKNAARKEIGAQKRKTRKGFPFFGTA